MTNTSTHITVFHCEGMECQFDEDFDNLCKYQLLLP